MGAAGEVIHWAGVCLDGTSGEASCPTVSNCVDAYSCQPASKRTSERRSLVLAFIVKWLLSLHSNTASVSISTSISGEISLLTSTMLVAGRIAAKNSPCARPIFSHSAMFVTKILVRTTSFNPAPAFASAASMFRIVCTVCAYASPTPTILPSGPVAVVPETAITFPIRTALE
jgi:hypothetical protein